MSDLIDRQAAIKTIDDLPNCENGYSDTYDKAYIIGVLEELPSAQPEIIRCKDCKKNPHWEWVGCPMTGKGTRKPDDFCSYAERRKNDS